MSKHQDLSNATAVPVLKRIRGKILQKIDRSNLWGIVTNYPFQSVLAVLTLVVCLLILWIFLAEVNRVVVARGVVITSQPKYAVRPFNKSVVRTINVRVGEIVKKGDTLFTLDPTQPEAEVTKLADKYESYRAQAEKLETHISGKQTFNTKNHKFADWQLQGSSFVAEKLQYDNKINEYDEKIARLQEYLVELKNKHEFLGQQVKVAEKVFTMWDELVHQHNFGSMTNYYKAQNDLLQLRTQITENNAELHKTTREKASLEAEKRGFMKEWEAKKMEDLASARRDMREAQQNLIKARTENKMVRMEAYENAVILEVGDYAIGSVVSPTDTLLKMVPLTGTLYIEAKITSQDIAYVSVGQQVDIKLDTLPFQRFGQLNGKVITISQDAFAQDKGDKNNSESQSQKSSQNDQAYHLVRIEITGSSLRGTPDTFKLIPGITVTADIRVGKRSVSEFLLFPIQKALRESLREP